MFCLPSVLCVGWFVSLCVHLRPQEAPGGLRRPQETPGGSRRPQEAPGGPKRLQEAAGGSRRPPGGSEAGSGVPEGTSGLDFGRMSPAKPPFSENRGQNHLNYNVFLKV